MINPESEEIISLAFAKGKVRDFQLFKNSKMHLKPGAQLTADSVYQGITKLHASSISAKKVYQKLPLIEARSKKEQKYLKKTYRD